MDCHLFADWESFHRKSRTALSAVCGPGCLQRLFSKDRALQRKRQFDQRQQVSVWRIKEEGLFNVCSGLEMILQEPRKYLFHFLVRVGEEIGVLLRGLVVTQSHQGVHRSLGAEEGICMCQIWTLDL